MRRFTPCRPSGAANAAISAAGRGAAGIELINASYDDRRHELVTLDKGRGAGDCGIQTRRRFDGQRFSLSRYAQQPTCDNWQGPDAWPTLWITR